MMIDSSLARGEQTRIDILDAAFDLFGRQGYHGTSMRQIAQAAGIALGGIYNHFENKEQIFIQVLLEHHPIYEVLPHLSAARGETLSELVADAASQLVHRFDERLDFLHLMFVELVEFEARHLDVMFDEIFPQLMAFGQRLQAFQSEMRPIPIPIVLRSFISFFFSYVITEYLIGKHLPPEMQARALEHSINIFLFGITKRHPVEHSTDLDHP